MQQSKILLQNENGFWRAIAPFGVRFFVSARVLGPLWLGVRARLKGKSGAFAWPYWLFCMAIVAVLSTDSGTFAWPVCHYCRTNACTPPHGTLVIALCVSRLALAHARHAEFAPHLAVSHFVGALAHWRHANIVIWLVPTACGEWARV